MDIATLMLTCIYSHVEEKKAVVGSFNAYLTSPESAAWIREVYPEAKLSLFFATLLNEPTPYMDDSEGTSG